MHLCHIKGHTGVKGANLKEERQSDWQSSPMNSRCYIDTSICRDKLDTHNVLQRERKEENEEKGAQGHTCTPWAQVYTFLLTAEGSYTYGHYSVVMYRKK